jgi:hypothetical protein
MVKFLTTLANVSEGVCAEPTYTIGNNAEHFG